MTLLRPYTEKMLFLQKFEEFWTFKYNPYFKKVIFVNFMDALELYALTSRLRIFWLHPLERIKNLPQNKYIEYDTNGEVPVWEI